MNNFSCTGNLGRDAQVRNAGGTPVCNFSVDVKSGYGNRAQTIWLDCALWGKRAESGLVPYLVKGQTVGVHGELGTREHEGKTYLTLKVADITLLGGKSDAQPARQPAQQQAPADDFDSDDIPF